MSKKILAAGFIGIALGLTVLWKAQAADPEVGKNAPAFTLPDTAGGKKSLTDYKGKYIVLEWVNHGCPFVQKHYNSGNMQSLQKELTGRDAVWLSISSSAEGKQGFHTAAEWNELTQEKGAAPTAVLLDGDGKVGKRYGAKTTPHIFLISPEGALLYKGAIDDSPSTDVADVKTAKNHLRTAFEEAKSGKPVREPSTKPYGCSIKYK
ncbi:MAG: thioredoxin family protein [Elusimicrobia bacterium]|nr:thioredoxin family protein [Elusimicrobiota bacterium]